MLVRINAAIKSQGPGKEQLFGGAKIEKKYNCEGSGIIRFF